ncbi:MAG: hypothetical protein V3U84_02955 [Thiotrichaceae bacterium]
MIEKSKRPSRRGNVKPDSQGAAVDSAQTQANQPIAVSPMTQPATAAQNQAVTPGRATREFREISNRLTVVSSLFRAQLLQTPCRGEGRWCLPVVNCKSRLTFSQTAQDAFVNNQEFCENEAPVLNLSGQSGADFATNFVPMGDSVNIADDSNATLTDDNNITSLTVTITNLLNGAAEVLDAVVTKEMCITALYNSGVLSLIGSATAAAYQEVLRTITYKNDAAAEINGTLRVIEFVANDGISNSNTAFANVTICPAANTVPKH